MQEEVGEENDDKWNPRSDNNKAHVLLNFTSPHLRAFNQTSAQGFQPHGQSDCVC